MTIESLPPEKSSTGRSNSAATSRKMMDRLGLEHVEVAQAVVGVGDTCGTSGVENTHTIGRSGRAAAVTPITGRYCHPKQVLGTGSGARRPRAASPSRAQ